MDKQNNVMALSPSQNNRQESRHVEVSGRDGKTTPKRNMSQEEEKKKRFFFYFLLILNI